MYPHGSGQTRLKAYNPISGNNRLHSAIPIGISMLGVRVVQRNLMVWPKLFQRLLEYSFLGEQARLQYKDFHAGILLLLL
jgi:hypothetical protein